MPADRVRVKGDGWPWRGPYIAGMSACGVCGAMVVYDGRLLHEMWHRKQDR